MDRPVRPPPDERLDGESYLDCGEARYAMTDGPNDAAHARGIPRSPNGRRGRSGIRRPGEVLGNQTGLHRSLADGGSYTLGPAAPDVPNCKDAGSARLKQVGRAAERRPRRTRQELATHLRPGPNIAAVVE